MDLNEILLHLSASTDSDFYTFVGEINDDNADRFIFSMKAALSKRPNCSLILSTYGGSPDAGYRVMRTIKRYYKSGKLSLYLLGSCKSAGTLMALAADEIIMSDFSELGPLDIQLTKDDELSNTSGLNLTQSLTSLNQQLFRFFEDNFMSLKRKSGFTITTKTASEISSKLAIGLISPISAQIEPVKLGEVLRAINIAEQYGQRLCRDASREQIAKLILNYPSHSFVIDFEEAQEVFGNVRWINDDELILEGHILNDVRRPDGQEIIGLMTIVLPPKPAAEDNVDKLPEIEVPLPKAHKKATNGAAVK